MLMQLRQVPLAALATLVVLAHAILQASAANLSTTAVTSPVHSSPSSSDMACNNSPRLCRQRYNNITHMGAHNIPFLTGEWGSPEYTPFGNQFKNTSEALTAGVRLLQAQVHKRYGQLKLCHSDCGFFDAGTLELWLREVNAWVTKNPHEVVTLLLVNTDKAPASEIGSVFESSNISELAYRPPSNVLTADWPTLESMISNNTRVVSFVTNMAYSDENPYLLPEFDHIWETHFEVTDLDGFNCTIHRPANVDALDALGRGYMSLVNHFKGQTTWIPGVYYPDINAAESVNNAGTSEMGNLGKHLQQCRIEWNKAPNFVLVDFWDKGDPIAAVNNLNNVTDDVAMSKPSVGGKCQRKSSLP